MSGVLITGITANSNITPMQLGFLREIFTFLLLLGFFLMRDKKLPRIHKKDWLWLFLMGGVGIGSFHWVWNNSVLINGVGVATMLQFNELVVVALVGVLFFKDKLNWKTLTAIIGSLIGTALISGIVGLDKPITPIGLSFGLASAVIHAAYVLFGKKLTGDYDPLAVLLYAFGFGTLALLPFQFFEPGPLQISTTGIGYLALIVLVSTLGGYALYTTGQKQLPVSTAFIIGMAEMPLAVFFGWLFFREQLGGWQFLGGLLIVAGVVLVSLDRKLEE